jgi:hypothetical protein
MSYVLQCARTGEYVAIGDAGNLCPTYNRADALQWENRHMPERVATHVSKGWGRPFDVVELKG